MVLSVCVWCICDVCSALYDARVVSYGLSCRIGSHSLPHQELYKMFISFEKQFGDRDAIEDVIVGKRRFQCVAHTHTPKVLTRIQV